MNISQESGGPESESGESHGKEPELAPDVTPAKPKSCFFKLLLLLVVGLAIVAGGMTYVIFEAQKVPEFYAKVLETDLATAAKDGQMFERNLIQLQNTAHRRKPWKVKITQDQVNGWFTSDLVEKFPDSLPSDISNPRVVFEEHQLMLAFKYDVSKVSGIVVITAEVFCTDVPNEIAIQINDVRTGPIRLPVGPWLETVGDSIRRAGIPVFWSKSSDVPLAIFTLPEHVTTKATQHVVIESIDLKPESLVIAGKTIRTPVEEKSTEKSEESAKAKRSAESPSPAATKPGS